MLDDKEVALVKREKQDNQWAMGEADLQARLRMANELLLQRDQELKAKWQRAKRALLDKAEGEKEL